MASDELIVLLPSLRPGPRHWILWEGEFTPPVMLNEWHVTHCGIVAAYDAHELARACQVWAEAGVRCNAESIVREVFGDNK